LALVLVVLVAGLVVTQVQLAHQRSVNTNLTSDRTSAVATARTDARNVASYDYRHLHQDFTRVEHEATPAFRRSFVQSSGGLTKVLLQYHATASATVLSAGLVSLTSSKAVVILFVNQTVANTAQKGGPTTDNSRIRVTLVRSGSGWLLDKLSLL
jgi:Mce-associated membrane protein